MGDVDGVGGRADVIVDGKMKMWRCIASTDWDRDSC